MSHSRKYRRSHSAEGGITVLEPPADTPPDMASIEGYPQPESVQVSTDVNALTADLWLRGKSVTAVWSKNENRNSWVAIAGVGWKKLADSSDSANIALTILASQALQTARNIDYREESDGMIHEIYVW